MIIEESENLAGDRIATVKGPRGEEYLINVDKAVDGLARLFSDHSHENRGGWQLNVPWYEEELATLRCAALASPAPKGEGQ